jgi:predicted phage tail protein
MIEDKVLVAPQGAGGGGKSGGGSGGTPTDAPDSLQSIAFVSALDLLCEGEIQGLVNGLQSIFLNGVPVVEENGTPNFSGTTIAWTNGTQTQEYVPGFPAVQQTSNVSTQVINSVPITAIIDNPECTSAVITLSVGELSNTNTSTGDVSGSSATLVVSVQPTGGTMTPIITATFTGKTSTQYERSYSFQLPGTGPWTVEVKRTTPDSTSDYLVNTTYFDALTSIIDQQLTYPNSVVVGMQLDARQFTSIPARTYLVDGLLIQVPSNYNPITRAYSGAWDGSFQIAYSNNPAWCLYDLLSNTRYGLGQYLNTYEIDTAALYEIGQYCDELVPDGFGGQEPRFQLNACLNSSKAAYDMIQDLCSVFRGMSYWGLGTVLMTQDSPQAPTAFFSPANVVGGQFNYSGSQRADRHTVAYVQYNDPLQQYAQNTEYVEVPDGIARYGVRPVQILSIGTTNRGQAYRLGMWTLLTEQIDTDQLTFKAGMDAAQLTPGQIIQIADPIRAGERMGGRILAGTTDSVTLDSAVTLDPGQTYTLFFMDSTGTQQSVGIVNTQNTTNELSFLTPLYVAPNPSFMWALTGSDLNLQLFRVINVQESERNIFDVLAVSFNESKFNAIDFGTALVIPPITILSGLGATLPTSWQVTPASYLIAPGVLGQKLILSWSGNTTQYQLQYQVNGGVWVTIQTHTPGYDILGVTAGDVYDFRLFGVSADGSLSASLDETYTVPKLGAAPGAPTNLTAKGGLQSVVLNWSAPTNLDLNYFQVFEATSNNLAAAVLAGNNIGSTTWTVGGLESGETYYYWVRAVNTSGVIGPYNSSAGTSATTLTIQPGDFNIGSILAALEQTGSVTTAMIANSAVTAANIAAQAVGSAQIANAAILTSKLANQAVNNAQIAAAAIATGNIQSGAVTATQIANASIGSAAIQNGAITTALIGVAQIGTAQIANDVVTTALIQNGAITTALIQTGAIGTAQIEYAAITSALIANEAVGTAQIQELAVGTFEIGNNAVTVPSFASGFGGTGTVASGTFSGQICTITLHFFDTANVATVVSWQASVPGSSTNAAIKMTVDGGLYMDVSNSCAAGFTSSFTAASNVEVGPGTHTFVLTVGDDWSSGSWNLWNWSVLLIGVMK